MTLRWKKKKRNDFRVVSPNPATIICLKIEISLKMSFQRAAHQAVITLDIFIDNLEWRKESFEIMIIKRSILGDLFIYVINQHLSFIIYNEASSFATEFMNILTNKFYVMLLLLCSVSHHCHCIDFLFSFYQLLTNSERFKAVFIIPELVTCMKKFSIAIKLLNNGEFSFKN